MKGPYIKGQSPQKSLLKSNARLFFSKIEKTYFLDYKKNSVPSFSTKLSYIRKTQLKIRKTQFFRVSMAWMSELGLRNFKNTPDQKTFNENIHCCFVAMLLFNENIHFHG